MAEQKYCKDCVHFVAKRRGCDQPAKLVVSAVDGRSRWVGWKDAQDYRKDVAGRCGVNGKYWVSRPRISWLNWALLWDIMVVLGVVAACCWMYGAIFINTTQGHV